MTVSMNFLNNHMANNLKIINNRESTMYQALVNVLEQGNITSIDISVAFFYFSGWQLLAKYLKDIPVRIVVGNYIDPNVVKEMLSASRREGGEVELARYAPRNPATSRTGKKQEYIKSFVEIFNESSIFDNTDQQEALMIFEQKIQNGSLEIKMTKKSNHEKLYILHSNNEADTGTVFMGSSNFTYNGLIAQGELNEQFDNMERVIEYSKHFQTSWNDSVSINVVTPDSRDEFLDTLDTQLWIHAKVDPYIMYLRVLHELFSLENEDVEIETPEKITNGQYIDLQYQVDAIKSAIEKIDKYDGVIVADVVGLGKSIIASAVAHNMAMRTVIIAPPHLKNQWEDYQAEFKIPGTQIFSSGNIKQVYEKYNKCKEPVLIVIDEAHRFRNEDTDDYKKLWQITRSHPDNKILLLTATPFNNDPKDVFALIKLFQTPGRSTIRSIDNLSLRFRELITRYKKLNRARTKEKLSESQIASEADIIAKELRRLIETVVIRRSRLDLDYISKYKKDLERQNIKFAEVAGPELKEYVLGELTELYLDTLEKLTNKETGFIGARYKPTTYVDDITDFLKKYGEDLDESDLKTAQTNLASFMKRLLVMRFESSKEAFRKTLQNIISSNELIKRWYDEVGKIPIYKKGEIPDPDFLLENTDSIDEELKKDLFEDELEKLRTAKGLIAIDASSLNENFITELEHDIAVLHEIQTNWFGSDKKAGHDPKVIGLTETLSELLQEDPKRKIVVFSSYADTVNYLYDVLSEKSDLRLLKYTSADKSKQSNDILKKNFDASVLDDTQSDDYDVLLATDAISEGYNLHRAGIIINYDIPYNPTRVIQRIGRINRINKKVFDKLYIYNYFPTHIGEKTARIKEVSTLKMRLINSVIGTDTQILTNDEEVRSFFIDQYKKSEERQEQLSWDAPYRQIYEQSKDDKDLIKLVLDIPPRSRVIRPQMPQPAMVGFGKKGSHSIFAVGSDSEGIKICSAEDALRYFSAEPGDVGEKGDESYDRTFALIRDELFKKHELPKIQGRRQKALEKIQLIKNELPKAKNYCDDLKDIIEKYDDLSEGAMKDIAQLEIKDIEKAFKELQLIIPEYQIEVINQRVNKFEDEHEIILLSQEHRI